MIKADKYMVPASGIGVFLLALLGILDYNNSLGLLSSPHNAVELIILAILGLAVVRLLVLILQCLVHAIRNLEGMEMLVWSVLLLVSGIPAYVYYYSHEDLQK